MKRTPLFVAAAVVLALGLNAAPSAHEIPRHVTVHAFVNAEGDRLRVLVRVPLGAIRDIDFPQRDGFLDVARTGPALREAVALWILPDLQVFEEDRALPPPAVVAARASLPSDRSFGSYADALAHMRAPQLPPTVQLPWQQAVLDALLEYPIHSDRAAFSIRPAFQRLGVDEVTALRYVRDGRLRAFEFHGDPGIVRLDPRWHQAAAEFATLGFLHILGGVDHLLFLACLVIPLRRVRPLVLVVTAFTAAHSATLLASALGFVPDALWFPALVETLIAASIVYMAIENIVAAPVVSRRCAVAFGFGLVHGFGYSFALRETLQFSGSHLLASLVSFNIGVELGQFLVLVALVPMIRTLFRFVVAERIGTIVLSGIIAHTAWHWMEERWEALRQFPAPAPDAATLLTLTRVVLALVAVTALMWVAGRLLGRPAAFLRRSELKPAATNASESSPLKREA